MILVYISKVINCNIVVAKYVSTLLISIRAQSTQTKLQFNPKLTCSDPKINPVLIIGQLKHLRKLRFEDVEVKFKSRIVDKQFYAAVKALVTTSKNTCSLYLNHATIAKLPECCSRHNTPSRSHAITKLVKECMTGLDESIIVVCERQDLYASACAVARAFPEYSRKTTLSDNCVTVNMEFIIVPSPTNCNLEISDCDIDVLKAAATGIRTAARIVDTPCNEMNVFTFLDEITRVGNQLGIVPQIICGEELSKWGLCGIYNVGKAATVPAALAVLSHCPPCSEKTIAWVGKGIVYDTGGLSIKTMGSMAGMKRDCGGAAGILGAFYAAVKNNFTQKLHAVFCLAENSVGPNATRPDDIHTLYSGHTVEVRNTDAEGRLVLADGVVFAKRDLKADIILDMATLTGLQPVTTGKYHAAVLSNSNDWEHWAVFAGRVSGDLVFPVPYCPELHFKEFRSDVADMKNVSTDRRNAGVSVAGTFIASHLGFDFPGAFLHIDMAAPVMLHPGGRASGYGIALLTTLFGKYTNRQLLCEIGPNLDMPLC